MGHLTGGPYYDLIGRTGNNVGRRVRGKNVFSMRPHRGNRTSTEAQLAVQLKMGLISSWMSDVSAFLKLGFEHEDPKMSAWNAAVKYNLDNAVTGVYPNFTVDYPNALFSKGKLSPLASLSVAAETEAQLDFSWSAAIEVARPGGPTDKATFIVYNPLKQDFVVSPTGVVRSGLTYDMALPLDFSGDEVEVYAAVLSVDNKLVSTSVYVGSILVV
ncbi:DUF6266 family protein [Pedobacter deserti]|uniref:DUF6266 family protein n=1 Tax=Pedobacter deserti TaxID=2817382 RepID=UPI00210985E8|nr:DUF6266 family protein [Pedobacter sp. SYSU D00382]